MAETPPPLLDVKDLAVHFQLGSKMFGFGDMKTLRAVEGVDLHVKAGECLGLSLGRAAAGNRPSR
jgi:peptide/nickel transport system ATP-binding protein